MKLLDTGRIQEIKIGRLWGRPTFSSELDPGFFSKPRVASLFSINWNKIGANITTNILYPYK